MRKYRVKCSTEMVRGVLGRGNDSQHPSGTDQNSGWKWLDGWRNKSRCKGKGERRSHTLSIGACWSPDSIKPTSPKLSLTRVTEKFHGKSATCHGEVADIRGSHGDVSGFQTIATCRDGLQIPVTSRQPARFRRENREIGDVWDKSTGMSRVCPRFYRGRHGEVGIMEFGLYAVTKYRA